MTPCWIFDIDGTLANGRHREHHIVRTDGGPKDWVSYFKDLQGDTVHRHIWHLAHATADTAPVIYVTGRGEETASATLAWLGFHQFPMGRIYYRPKGDRRADDIIKIELLAKIRADGFEPIMAFDDRSRVVAAWRAAGIPCAQVAEGDF